MTNLSITNTSCSKRRSFFLGVSALAVLMSAQLSLAQVNDTDGYDGTVILGGCPDGSTAITGAATAGRTGNGVTGERICIGNSSIDNLVSGSSNTLGLGNRFNAVSGDRNVIGAGSTSNHVSGTSNVLGTGSTRNTVSGLQNTLGLNTLENSVSGQLNILGDNNQGNAVSGSANTLGEFNLFNLVSGSSNTLGGQIESSLVSGRNNTLTGLPGVGNSQESLHILGSFNTIGAFGSAGSGINILGDFNAVNGAGSGWNTITGHHAVVSGTGNFVAGGNASTGASVSGNDNVVIGAGASSTVDNGVAIGSGSSATLSTSAAQAATTGSTINGVIFTEGTDATGGEMNIGNRLLTGVADGRIASGSSDAVNGHQLYTVVQASSAVSNAAIAINTSAISTNSVHISDNALAILNNTSLISGNTTLISENNSLIDRNFGLISDNREQLKKVTNGVALAVAIPDAYLDRSETMAIAGGLSIFDGEVGAGLGLTIRGNESWSFSVGTAFSGNQATGKIQARWSK